jgi:hypothetical protein
LWDFFVFAPFVCFGGGLFSVLCYVSSLNNNDISFAWAGRRMPLQLPSHLTSATPNFDQGNSHMKQHYSMPYIVPRLSIVIEIEIEIVYNMYRMRRYFTKSRMRRLLSMGPPNYAIQGTYKSGLDR